MDGSASDWEFLCRIVINPSIFFYESRPLDLSDTTRMGALRTHTVNYVTQKVYLHGKAELLLALKSKIIVRSVFSLLFIGKPAREYQIEQAYHVVALKILRSTQ